MPPSWRDKVVGKPTLSYHEVRLFFIPRYKLSGTPGIARGFLNHKKNPAGNLQGPSIPKKASFFWEEGKGRGETGGRTYGET
jgi:hypothetical protein